MKTENISTLKIHKLTQAQYDRELAAGNIDPNALYLTPDENADLSDFMPTTGGVFTGGVGFTGQTNGMFFTPNADLTSGEGMVLGYDEHGFYLNYWANGAWKHDIIRVDWGTGEVAARSKLMPTPANASTGDLLMYNGTKWVSYSKADLIAEVIAALPSAEEATV